MCDDTKNTVGVGNTKQPQKRFRGWCFTLNNYTEEEYQNIKENLHNYTEKYIVGSEVGASGTPHLQGYIYMKEAKVFDYIKHKLLCTARVHLEKAKGTPKQNFKYCSKDGSYISKGFDEKSGDGESDFKSEMKRIIETRRNALLKHYETIEWRGWQKRLLDILDTEADTRTIHWVFDPIGNSGKSFLTKYLYLTRKIIIADGKKDNIFNQVLQMVNGDEKKKILPEEPDVIILDIPRSSEGYINYGVLEQLKNGLIYSGKYEGGICAFNAAHVVVLANFMPDISQFSEDRWNIIRVTKP